jgi:hypothetical protein
MCVESVGSVEVVGQEEFKPMAVEIFIFGDISVDGYIGATVNVGVS